MFKIKSIHLITKVYIFCDVKAVKGLVETLKIHTPELYNYFVWKHRRKCLTLPFFVPSEPKSVRHNHPSQIPKPILKPSPPPVTKTGPASPPAVAFKVALMPPKQAVKPPPLPPPKPVHKPLPPPPLPPPKLHSPTSPTATDQPQHTNGVHGPPSPLRSPDYGDAAGENGEAGLEGELEVGSMVEVNDPPLFGVIRWIGRISGISEPVAGIELVKFLLQLSLSYSQSDWQVFLI